MTSKSLVEELLETTFDPESADDSLDSTLEPDVIRQAVLFATDWTVGTLLGQLEKGNIDITPRFQRRDVWKLDRKSKYIESLMLHLPVPHLVLAELQGKRGKYLVLDGRQRLLSLMQFAGIAKQSPMNAFRLTSLEVLRTATDRDWDGLDELDGVKSELENATVRTVVVRNWTDSRLLHLLFTRLNMETVKLNSQELRLALFPGPFTDYVDDQSIASAGLATLFRRKSGEVDPRMRDSELLLRYFAFRHFLSKYDGVMRLFLDDACAKLNKAWSREETKIRTEMDQFEKAVAAGIRIFGDGFGKRWNADAEKYTGNVNRAVLDVLIYYLSQIADGELKTKERKVVAELQTLFDGDRAFVESIDATARHGRNSSDRFYIFGAALKKAGLPVVMPQKPTKR